MKSRRTSLIVAATLIVAAALLFVVLNPGDSDDAPQVTNSATTGKAEAESGQKQEKNAEPAPPPVPTVVVKDGEPVDGVLGIEVSQGEQISFKVVSDVAEEIHVHGYDISSEVAAGGSARISFKADITGIFEAELENSGVQIVELQVNP